MKIHGNSGNIEDNEKKIYKIADDVHTLQLSDKDIAHMAQQSLNQWTEVGQTLKAMQIIQQNQAILLDRNTTKLDTLTKD